MAFLLAPTVARPATAFVFQHPVATQGSSSGANVLPSILPVTFADDKRKLTFNRRITVVAVASPDFSPPELDASTPSPEFGGNTGGLMGAEEEVYLITWDSDKEHVFEVPTGGAAQMRLGQNLLKFARKEQCLALGTQLRTKFKLEYQFYRVLADGTVEYLHPKDGVYPEKVNAGRVSANVEMRSIGDNTDQSSLN